MQWVCQEYGGIFWYDYQSDTFKIDADKAQLETPIPLPRADVEHMSVELVDAQRASVRILNSFADSPSVNPIENELKPNTLFRDRLARCSTLPM